MKTLLVKITLLVLLSGSLKAQGNLQIVVKNIKSSVGAIRVGLFVTEETFLKKAAEGRVVKVSGTEVIVSFENLKPGDYGISVFHDENENSELDKNFIGMPKEGFAFGNNSMGTFGPPDFEDAKVRVEDKKNISQTISLKYL